MTSLLPRPTASSARPGEPGERPLAVIATLGGVVAALIPIAVCGALGVIGWFLSDLGSHGSAGSAARYGVVGWLMGHGAGVHVAGVPVTAIPLAVSLICGRSMWRVGLRVGEQLAGHGPDAHAIGDGERDWTVALGTALFTSGYLLVLLGVAIGVASDLDPNLARAITLTILGCATVAGSAIATGSGRAAIWTATLPESLRGIAVTASRLVISWLVVSAVVFVGALLVDIRTAANVMSQLHTGVGDAIALIAASVLVVPNAILFSSAYLAGPGFTVGVGTMVAPNGVVLGSLPMFPMLAALPDNGTPPAWVSVLIAAPALIAAVAVARAQRRSPVLRWDEALVRGLGGGVVAAIGIAVATGLAGGAVGPGRMRDVAPLTTEVFAHLAVSFGLGGLVGALVMTWWQRRTLDSES